MPWTESGEGSDVGSGMRSNKTKQEDVEQEDGE